MPDNGRRTESKGPAFLLQAPTDIHVIASHSELWIKAANRLQGRHTKSHIASRNVFRFTVGQQNMNGPARGVRHTISDQAITRWRNIGTANTGKSLPRGIQKSRDEIGQPI